MSLQFDRAEQPSAAKPRDLQQDLATAALPSSRKRKGGDLAETEVRCVMTAMHWPTHTRAGCNG